MAKFPAMPLWTDAYLADCGHLDDPETGRYLMILILLWRAPKQRFPNDDVWLARKFRRSVEDVKTQIRPLISEFCLCSGNWITQDRLSREFAYVSEKSKKQSDRAKSRWNKEKDVCQGDADAHNAENDPASVPDNTLKTKIKQPSRGNAPTPTPTPLKEEKERATDVAPKKSPAFILSPLLGNELAAAVVEHRQRLRKPMTVKAAELMLREFEKCTEPIAGAEMMISRGWQGFRADWFRNDTNRQRTTGDERLARKLEMARRFDGQRKADDGVADEGGGRAVAPLLSTERR